MQYHDHDFILPPLKAHAGRNQAPRGLQHAAQGLKGNSMKYRYGGDRCLQCVAKMALRHNAVAPSIGEEPDEGIVKR